VLEKEILGLIETELRSAYAIPVKQPLKQSVRPKDKVMAHYFLGRPGAAIRQAPRRRVFKELEARSYAGTILDTGQAHRRP